MFHEMPAHLNELLLLQKQVGSELAGSRDISGRVWGLHLLEDWKTLYLWVQRSEGEREDLDGNPGTESVPVQAEAGASDQSVEQ